MLLDPTKADRESLLSKKEDLFEDHHMSSPAKSESQGFAEQELLADSESSIKLQCSYRDQELAEGSNLGNSAHSQIQIPESADNQ